MPSEKFLASIEENKKHLRLIYLYQMLKNETDSEHKLSTPQIIDKMQREHDIQMHRTTVPHDIALLRKAGYDIVAERRKAFHYYLDENPFDAPELKILIDAVQSSKFITEKKSSELVDKLSSLAGKFQKKRFQRNLNIPGRIKSDNEKGYYIVDAIQEAIQNGKKISFTYFDYSAGKRKVLTNDGNPYTLSPYDLIWDGDFYYVIGYCDERSDIRVFRVDRIENAPELLDEAGVKKPKKYQIKRYTQESFRMFATDEPVMVSLLCDNKIMKSLIDEFGIKVKTKIVDKEHFMAQVKVCVSPTFLRWVFGWGDAIQIVSPDNVVEEYKAMLEKVMHQYEAK